MKDCMATEFMMDKARIVTLIQKLCGERIQIKNPCSASNCLNYSNFRVQSSYLSSQLLPFFFVWTVKTTLITECFPMQFG